MRLKTQHEAGIEKSQAMAVRSDRVNCDFYTG